ncbi:hypothetical protein F4860DRAFT_517002 [Xylaria cubensis]|nr:hypothetical protein F4860DRAFT_517002 [Xylaria cubensis]
MPTTTAAVAAMGGPSAALAEQPRQPRQHERQHERRPEPRVGIDGVEPGLKPSVTIDPRPRDNRVSPARGPNEYAQAIYRHSRRSILTSSFPGHNYVDLADWLLRPNQKLRPTLQPAPQVHSLAVLHDLDGSGAGKTLAFGETGIASLVAHPAPKPGLGHLLFLRGHLLPSWITELGSRYRVDPEFFRRHLDFLSPASHGRGMDVPPLASSSNNIIHLNVNTIVVASSPYSYARGGFIQCNKDISERLARYRRQLPNTACWGDSIVREYTVLNEQYSIIKQRISVCITENGDGWLGLFWMDHGRSLDTSPRGPWISQVSPGQAGWISAPLPIIQHHPKMTFRNMGDIHPNNSSGSATTLPAGDRDLPQSTSALPMEYLSLLSAVDLAKRAKHDPLHALIPVFAHAASSEVAVLNLVTGLIDELMEPLPLDDIRNNCFERLQHYEVLVQRQAEQLRQCVRAIRVLSGRQELSEQFHLHQASLRPKSHVRHQDPDAATQQPTVLKHVDLKPASSFSASGILEDYEDLLERSLRLLVRITAAMNSEMNRAMILESRKAIEQSERTKKLTILATYFIPLTFTATIFGMNFELFGQGSLPLWWYVILALPLTLLTHLIYTWGVKPPQLKLRSWLLQSFHKTSVTN